MQRLIPDPGAIKEAVPAVRIPLAEKGKAEIEAPLGQDSAGVNDKVNEDFKPPSNPGQLADPFGRGGIHGGGARASDVEASRAIRVTGHSSPGAPCSSASSAANGKRVSPPPPLDDRAFACTRSSVSGGSREQGEEETTTREYEGFLKHVRLCARRVEGSVESGEDWRSMCARASRTSLATTMWTR